MVRCHPHSHTFSVRCLLQPSAVGDRCCRTTRYVIALGNPHELDGGYMFFENKHMVSANIRYMPYNVLLRVILTPLLSLTGTILFPFVALASGK